MRAVNGPDAGGVMPLNFREQFGVAGSLEGRLIDHRVDSALTGVAYFTYELADQDQQVDQRLMSSKVMVRDDREEIGTWTGTLIEIGEGKVVIACSAADAS